MDGAARRVRQAAADARSDDDLVNDAVDPWNEPTLDSPLDEETLDERASTQMGDMWESRRRNAE